MYSSLSIIRLAVYGISSQKAKIMKFLRVTNVKVPLLLVEQERALTAAMFIIAIIITLRALALRNDLNHQVQVFSSSAIGLRGGEGDGAHEGRDDGSGAATEDMDLRGVYEQLAVTPRGSQSNRSRNDLRINCKLRLRVTKMQRGFQPVDGGLLRALSRESSWRGIRR